MSNYKIEKLSRPLVSTPFCLSNLQFLIQYAFLDLLVHFIILCSCSPFTASKE
jgi:hypothetical protein